ncbi:apical polar ring protein APR2, putative [Plasmodium vivax]|nr:apical polar ring protein APR2, putative [Plasmodium vivax]
MRAQSETIKSSTPLRRIPKNRGTVVRNVSEINPMSEQELKNVIHVYSEANKAYYQNCVKNERNPKKKKKKNISQKTESEEFDTHLLNPLNYRNENFEENGALLHLPGSNVTPNYISQNPSADYGVSSLAYGTLHKSNPLSWGCDYKKHYELPTICSIVKSKHPIYSRPQNAKTGRKGSNVSLKNKSKKQNSTKQCGVACQNDKSFTVKKVPTFGNGKEDEIEDVHHDKHKSSEHGFEKNTAVDTTMKDSSFSDKSKDISDGTCNYRGFSNDSEGSSVGNSNFGGLKNVLEASEQNSNFTLKRQDYNEEGKNDSPNIQHKKRSKSQHNHLNVVNPRSINGMVNMPSGNSVDIILSNSTIMELRTSDTESKGAYCSSGECSGDSSDTSHDNSTPHIGMRRARNYKDRGKRKHKVAGHSSTKGSKPNGKSTKARELSACKESYYVPSSKVAERNTKQGKVSTKCKVPHPGEKHNQNGCADVMWENKNNKKEKQSGKHKNKDSSKNGLNHEPNLFDENCCSRGKKKGKTRGLKHGKLVRKHNLQSSSHVKNNKSLNMRTIHALGCQNGACAGNHNMVASKPSVKQLSNVERCSCVDVKDTPGEKFCATNEMANLVSRSTPKGETLTNREKEAYAEGGPFYAYAFRADTMPRTPLVTYNMCENVPQAGMKNLSQNVFAEVRHELANVNLCAPEYTARRYQSASVLPNFSAESVPEGSTPVPQSHFARAHPQVIHVPLELSQGRLHVQGAAAQVHGVTSQVHGVATQVHGVATQVHGVAAQPHGVAAQPHGAAAQTQAPILQTHVPITATLAPYGQAEFALKREPLPQAQPPQSQAQSQMAQMQQLPFIEKPIVLEQFPLASVISSGELRAADKFCGLTELTNQLVSVKGKNSGAYTTANGLSKPFDQNCNRSHSVVENSSGDLSKKQCSEGVFTNGLIKGSANMDGRYTINGNSSKCIDPFKGSDTKGTFSNGESGVPSWVKTYVDTQTTSLKGEAANVGYLNVYTNKINEKANPNVSSSMEILQCLSSIESPPSDVYHQPHTPQHVAHKKKGNPQDLSQLIKTSNEKLINMQKEQLLEILQEKGDAGVRKTIHTGDRNHHTVSGSHHAGDSSHHKVNSSRHPNGDSNVQPTNQVGGDKYQNLLGSMVQYFSYANPAEAPQNSAGEAGGVVFSPAPQEIGSRSQPAQNIPKLPGHLN